MTPPTQEDHRDGEQERVVIRDNRKIDRTPGAADSPPPAESDPAVDQNALLLEERTADLQRVQAEYANYRKRAERDRLAAGEIATGRVLAELIPVLDDLDRARAHGDLEAGPLKGVADKLEASLTKLGLTRFGDVGDPFDPSLHEAVLHDESDEVDVPTTTTVMRPGYRHHDRLLRPAMVGVTDPAERIDAEATESESQEQAARSAGKGEEEAQGDNDQLNNPPADDA